jgi:two-component system phosphate regulon sensor histidine kinase PhoR
MSLRLQFIAPVLIVLALAVVGWLVGSIGWLVALGGALSIVASLYLGNYAVRRVTALARLPARPMSGNPPFLEATGTFDEIDGAHSDLARWLSAERATIDKERSQTDRQIRMLDRLADGVMLVDEHGSVIYANVSAPTLLAGRNPVGGSFIAAVRDHEMADALSECLDHGTESRRNFEIPGDDRVVEAIIARVSQSPPEAVVVMRDVTEFLRLQTLRRDFVANVSHELRTPLSTVKILTETIVDLVDDDSDASQFLEKIEAEVDSMTALVEDLLQLTQIESVRNPLNRSCVCMSDLVLEVAERLRPLAERHQISLATEVVPPDLKLFVDERRVKQALINLVSNAIAHTGRGGNVSIAVNRHPSTVSVAVTDTGIGIPADDLERVWERFYKVDRSRSEPGTGLGLAIVKHVAQAHGGSVRVQSQIGRGSTFEFRLPIEALAS